MVFKDLSSLPEAPVKDQERPSQRIAPVSDRLLAFVFDLILFTPVVGFILARLFRKLERMYFLSPQSTEFVVLSAVAVVFVFVISILIQAFCLTAWNGTPGKLFFKMRVVNIHPPYKTIRFSQALLRSSAWALGALCLGIPWLEVLSQRHRRPLHDRASETMVVTLKKESDQGPHWLETQFVRQMLLVFSVLGMLWGIFGVGHFYRSALRGEFKKSELEQANYLCSTVSVTLADGEERLDKAAALYLAQEVSEDCLAVEADFVLWTLDEDDKSWGYFAKGLLNDHDSEMSEAYFKKACEESPASEACFLATAQLDDEKPAPQGSTLTAQVLRVQKHYEQGQYEQAEKAIESLAVKVGFEAFVQKSVVKSLWVQNHDLKAQGAYFAVKNNLESSERVELASWLCHEELDRSCGTDVVTACEDLKADVLNNGKGLDEVVPMLALIREKSCRISSDLSPVAISDFMADRPEVASYVKAISPESSLSKAERRDLLKKIAFREQSVKPYMLRTLALQGYVEMAQSSDDLAPVIEFLEKKKNKDFLWMKIFRKTSSRLADLKAVDLQKRVAALPDEAQIKTYGLKKWMPAPVEGRMPASEEAP